MRPHPRRRCAPVWLLGLLSAVLVLGCQPVREDRTITWAPEGNGVGFQHGREGLFVADKDGGQLRNIFKPAADVLATSTPLWAPDGKRLIFTTARARGGATVEFRFPFQDPNGNTFTQVPVTYTCWLRPEEKDGHAADPVPLFEADCDHVGYVAANLAVRWHPAGDRVLFVRQTGHGHGLFEYDLGTKQTRSVFPHEAEAILFDWAPDKTHLCCVLRTSREAGPDDGIWIGQPRAGVWWRVPGSVARPPGQLPSLLEELRALRPAWTADGGRFAFVSCTPGAKKEDPGRYSLRLGTLAEQVVKTLADSNEPFRDLCWSPDGVLGVVRGGDEGTLHLVRPGEPLSGPVNHHPVRRLAGWSGDGRHLAYVAPGSIPFKDGAEWAILLLPDGRSRDAVLVTDGGAQKPEREVFSGLRVTFPQWSPREEKLSLWFTYSPAYRSWLSQWLGSSLRPGDPAAVFDVKTGDIGWMAVNAHEKLQVGHYHLLRREYALAWQWYAEAERDLPPARRRVFKDIWSWQQALQPPEDGLFFRYYCLAKLGRHEEARRRLEQFRSTFFPEVALPHEQDMPANDAFRPVREALKALLDSEGLAGSLLRDLYVAEVFLSLDAAADGEEFFRQELKDKQAPTAGRLSKAVVLGQLLLLQDKRRAHAQLTAETIAPALLELHRPGLDLTGWNQLAAPRAPQEWRDSVQELALTVGGGSALLPLCFPEFLAGLPDEQVRVLGDRWQQLRAGAADDVSRRVLDLALYASYHRLGMQKEKADAAARLAKGPGGFDEQQWEATMKEGLRQTRHQLRGLAGLP
jgi:hypothetical protein